MKRKGRQRTLRSILSSICVIALLAGMFPGLSLAVPTSDEEMVQQVEDTAIVSEDTAVAPEVNADEIVETEQAAEVSAGELADEASGVKVTVSHPAEAELPVGSGLSVVEIEPDDARYIEYKTKLIDALGDADAREISARFFDVAIVAPDGSEIEPASDVDVVMESDTIGTGDAIVHFTGEHEQPNLLASKTTDGAVSFSTESFSIYGIYRYNDADLTANLDGHTIIIANANPANNFIGFVTTTPKDSGLAPLKGYRRYHRLTFITSEEANPDGWTPGVWTFHALTEPDPSIGLTETIFNKPENAGILYSISTETADGTRYMSLGNGNMSLSTTPKPLRVIAGTGEHEGKVMIQNAKGAANESARLNLKSGDITKYFQGSTYAQINDNDWFTLFETEGIEIAAEDEQIIGNKISVSNLQDGDEIIIYHSEWDEATSSYVQLAINGYGDLVLLTDEGGTVGLYKQIAVESGKVMSSIKWRFTVGYNTDGTPSGYYWLQNTDTGAFLSPRALYDLDGNKTADIILPGDGIVPGTPESFDYSIQLPGRAEGDFVSSIAAWSYKDGTEGLMISADTDSVFGCELTKGLFGDADDFDFAKVIEEDQGLTEKETLDSTAMGIQIKMYDYSNKNYMNNLLGSSAISNIDDKKRTWFVPYLVDPILGDDGVPVSALTGQPLEGLFGEDLAMDANHLFLSSVYNETGYFGYNSAQNYAYYNQTGDNAGNFTVYNELGSPVGNRPIVHSHGHFMPFSRILEDVWPEKNTVDAFLHDLPFDDPRYGDVVHKIETNNSLPDNYDYQFGMSIETTFRQTLTKKDEFGNDSIFEFTGDDDLWVFIDNVLVLDLGGIHSAVSGKINFSSGQITYTGFVPKSADGNNDDVPLPPTTIKECFQQAGVFPDGTTWDNDRVDEYFDGDTISSSYSTHSIKMFYMERGGNSSNINVRFNLRTVRSDAILVGKTVSGTRKQDYMHGDFMFQAFKADGTPLTEAKVAEMSRKGQWNATDEDVVFGDEVIGGVTYHNVFHLNHGQGAYFFMNDSDEYYVKEIGIDDLHIGDVTVNDEVATATSTQAIRHPNSEGLNLDDVTSSVSSAYHRREIFYDNEMKFKTLDITKSLQLLPNQRPDPDLAFQFRVKVGASAQSLQPYSVQPYYVKTMVGGEQVYCTRIDGKIYPLTKHDDGMYYYTIDGEEFRIKNKDATDPVFDYSSQTGYIDYVPAGYTIEIQGMGPDMGFSVEETNIPSGYELVSIGDAGNTFVHISEAGATELVGEMADDLDAKVNVVNKYSEGTFRLKKVTAEDPPQPLEGAKFELYNAAPVYQNGTFHFNHDNLVAKFESDSDGFFRVEEQSYYGGEIGSADLSLAAGTYYLRETHAPEGYSLRHPISSFWIDNDGEFHINGLVEWDPVEGKIIYTSQDNLEVGDDTEIGGVVLQTGMISNVLQSTELELPESGQYGRLRDIGMALILSTLVGGLLVSHLRARRTESGVEEDLSSSV